MTTTDWRRGEFTAHADGQEISTHRGIDSAIQAAMNGVDPVGGTWSVTCKRGIEVACGISERKAS